MQFKPALFLSYVKLHSLANMGLLVLGWGQGVWWPWDCWSWAGGTGRRVVAGGLLVLGRGIAGPGLGAGRRGNRSQALIAYNVFYY